MEKTIKFAEFKESIIQRDELFRYVEKKGKSLRTSQQYNQLQKNEIYKLKLKNKELSNNLAIDKERYKSLSVDHNKLDEEHNNLKLEINNLHLKYQSACRSSNDYQLKLAKLEKEQNCVNHAEKKSPSKSKTEKASANVAKKIKSLNQEKEKLLCEKVDLQMEILDLKKQVESLENFQEISKKKESGFATLEKELKQMKESFKISLEHKDKEISELTQKINEVEKEKAELKFENEQLKGLNMTLQSQNFVVEEKEICEIEGPVVNEELRQASQTPVDEEICQIMSNVSVSQIQAIETPDEEICKIMSNVSVPQILTPMRNSSVRVNQENSPIRISHARVRRRNLIKRKRRKFVHTQVDLLGALVALKKANIDFIISNNSFVQPSRTFPTKLKKTNKRFAPFSKELSCRFPCCKRSYMVLQENGREEKLLGFIGVKNENNTKKSCDAAPKKNHEDIIEINDTEQTNESVETVDEITNEEQENVPVSENAEVPTVTKTIITKKPQRRKKRKLAPMMRAIKKQRMVSKIQPAVAKRNPKRSLTQVSKNNPKAVLPIRETFVPVTRLQCQKKDTELLEIRAKSPKTSFKRPVCAAKCKVPVVPTQKPIHQIDNEVQTIAESTFPLETPQSPTSGSAPSGDETSLLIPLEKNKMPSSKTVPLTRLQCQKVAEKVDTELPEIQAKSPKTGFKRPGCATKHIVPVVPTQKSILQIDNEVQTIEESTLTLETPQSPTDSAPSSDETPLLIPLEKIEKNKMSSSKVVPLTRLQSQKVTEKEDTEKIELPVIEAKSPKDSFKRPSCATKYKVLVVPTQKPFPQIVNEDQTIEESTLPLETPQSPTPDSAPSGDETPLLIPLEKIEKNKMSSSEIVPLTRLQCQKVTEKEDAEKIELPEIEAKSPKVSFKRPSCAPTYKVSVVPTQKPFPQIVNDVQTIEESTIPLETPQSPTSDSAPSGDETPLLIPLEKIEKNKMSSSEIVPVTRLQCQKVTEKEDTEKIELPEIEAKSPKLRFKRPSCAPKCKVSVVPTQKPFPQFVKEDQTIETPQSPTPDSAPCGDEAPLLIPLEKIAKNKMPSSKIEKLFNKLILHSNEEEALNEVVREFSSQEPDYIAGAILERISVDYHDKADAQFAHAPLMTLVQRTMLGFMSKLEKSAVSGVFDSYLELAELRLITSKNLLEMAPITRLYLAVCKLRKDVMRMRKLCCDIFYFCGDLAVPFLFIVLTSWTRVFLNEVESRDFPLVRVFVQLVHTKDCNTPGYNLMPIKDLLVKYYGYPSERWDFNTFFDELFQNYLKHPSKLTDFPLLLYCKYRPEKWVHEKIVEHIEKLVEQPIQENFKATLIILIGNLYSNFSKGSELVSKAREWFSSLIKDDTPDVVKRCIYVSLHRLRNK